MKRFFVGFAMACFMLIAGISLCACGSTTVTVSFSADSECDELVQFVVKSNGEVIEGRGDNYVFDKGKNLRVEIVATSCGVDFSNAVVTANGKQKSIVKNKDYDPAYSSEDFVYGTITLANLDEDLTVVISGVKTTSVVYDFEVENLDNEKAIDCMKMTYIQVDEEEEYENFYDFVTSENSTLTHSFSDQYFNAIKIRFGSAQREQYIFDVLSANPFSLRLSNGDLRSAEYAFDVSSGLYLVKFSNIVEQHYTIVADFSTLTYSNYTIIAPQSTVNYTISAPITTSYDVEQTLTIQKNTLRQSVVYDYIKVCLNELELALADDCDIEDDVLTYVIPSGITPYTTSTYGEVLYQLTVDGVTFSADTHQLTVADFVDDEVAKTLKDFKVYLLNEDGEKLFELPQENGFYTVVEGEKIGLCWNYDYDEENESYVSKYDILDFTIKILDGVLDDDVEDGETKYKTEETKIFVGQNITDCTNGQVVTLADGSVLRAICDLENSVITSVQFEFSCSSDREISFEDFKAFKKTINVSYEFSDAAAANVTDVQYATISDITNWQSLSSGSVEAVEVENGSTFAIRVLGSTYVLASEFELGETNLTSGESEVLTYKQGETYVTEFRYTISNVQSKTAQDFKFVSLN
jgi:hypothetical protein